LTADVPDETLEPAGLEFCDTAGNFLQSGFWGAFKARFGWLPFPFKLRRAGGASPLLVMVRPLGPGFSFAYVPWGPPEAGESLSSLARALRPLLPRSVAFIRFDPPWPGIVGPPLVKAPSDIQAPDTVLVDLSPAEGEILARMNPKWRYNIGLASRKGVAVRQAGEGELPVFYRLLQETARRDGIAVHSPDYYRTLFAHGRDYRSGGQELRLYLAEHEGEALGAIITLFRGAQGIYLYGASSGRKRNLMASYALQWRAMGDARAWGCRSYDLFGIPPSADPGHPMAGLYRFKTGFGGRIVRRPGSWDYPCRPLGAFVFRKLEKFRKILRDRKKTPSRRKAPDKETNIGGGGTRGRAEEE
jgi:lipid II:glycine glycyltransferase (peptidoglycan interpeptide bridge formation enzyme)